MNNPQTQLDKLRQRLATYQAKSFFPTREEKDQLRERVAFLKNQIRLAELVEANKSKKSLADLEWPAADLSRSLVVGVWAENGFFVNPATISESDYQDNDQLPF